jgi:hypothetical protein
VTDEQGTAGIKFTLDDAWKEMEEFLARFKASGPAKTEEELHKLNAEFVVILERYTSRCVAALEREKAPELATGDRKAIEP